MQKLTDQFVTRAAETHQNHQMTTGNKVEKFFPALADDTQMFLSIDFDSLLDISNSFL